MMCKKMCCVKSVTVSNEKGNKIKASEWFCFSSSETDLCDSHAAIFCV